MMARKLLFWILPLALLLAGCGGSTNDNPTDRPDPLVMFINASSDTPGVDFYLNDDLKARNVAYLTTSGGFQEIEFLPTSEGGYDVTAYPTGSTEEFDRQVQAFDRDTSSLIIAYGLRNFGSTPFNRAIQQALRIDRTRPVASKAKIIVFNGCLRSLGNLPPDLTIQTPGDNPLISIDTITFGATKELVVDAGTYVWQARRSDSDPEDFYAQTTASVGAGKIYFGVVSGVQGTTSSGQAPRITFFEIPTK